MNPCLATLPLVALLTLVTWHAAAQAANDGVPGNCFRHRFRNRVLGDTGTEPFNVASTN